MVCPAIFNVSVYINNYFGRLRRSGRQPETTINKLEKQMEKLKAKRNDIKNKIGEAKRDRRLASEEAKRWQRDLESLEGQVAAFFEDFTRISFQNNIKVGPWGVLGNNNFDIGQSASRITRVRLHAGGIVDNLEICYVVDGETVETPQLGSSRGGCYDMFDLDPGEYINQMVGFVGAYNGESCISQLEFNTNFGKRHGPYGGGGGDRFTVSVMDGQIVGFFGQYDTYLKSIGVYLSLN